MASPGPLPLGPPDYCRSMAEAVHTATRPEVSARQDARAATPGAPTPTSDREPATSAELDADLREVRGAAALVSAGWALDVIICGLHAPDEAAAACREECQEAHVGLRVEHDARGHGVVIVGPRET